MLGNRGDTAGQAAGEAHEHIFDGRRALVLGGEDLGVVGIEGEFGLVGLLRAEAEEALDRRLAVGAVDPLAGRPPRKLGGLRRLGERLAGAEQYLRR